MLAILILLTLWVLLIITAPPNTIVNNKYTANFSIFGLFIYVSILLAVTENNIPDMIIYVREFTQFSNISFSEAIIISDKEVLFTAFQWLISQISTSPSVFYVSIWVLFSFILIISLRKIFDPWHLLIVFFCYLNFFIFFGYITNGVRQGFAIAIIIAGASMLLIKNKKSLQFYLSIIAAPLFHISALPLSLSLFLIKKVRISLKVIIFVWFFFAFLYITGLNQMIFGQLSVIIPDVDSYTSESVLERFGRANRIDFLIFSGFWILYAVIALSKLLKDDVKYQALVKIYTLFNIYYLMFGFIGFSNRLASYSWFLIPVIVLYPLLKSYKRRPLPLLLAVILFVITSLATGSLLYNQPLLY